MFANSFVNSELFKLLYSVKTDNGDLLVSSEHKVYVRNALNSGISEHIKILNKTQEFFYVGERENEEKILDNKSLFINHVMMVKVFKNNNIIFESKNKNKTSDLNSFEITQVMLEIFKMLYGNIITSDDLFNLFIEGNSQISVLPFRFVNNITQHFRKLEVESHLIRINLSNLSVVIGKCSPSAIPLSFSAYSSLCSNSSTGYQSILSQNSWSFSESVPVLVNLSNIPRFINLTTALANNSESNVTPSFIVLINSAILTDNIENQDYLSFSISKNLSNFKLVKISELYSEIEQGDNKVDDLAFLDGQGRSEEQLQLLSFVS